VVKGDRALEVQGSLATTVHQGHALEVRGPRALVVGTPDRTAPSDHYVHGTASLGASERLVLQAEQGIVIQCGESSIELLPEKIVLRAKTVELSPTQVLECSTKDGPSMTLAGDVEILTKKFRLFTEAGALEVDREFKAAGDKIKLGYDPSRPSRDKQGEEPETKPFSCKLSNYFLQPYANKKYHLMAEGLRFEGETDGEGMVKAKIPRAAKQVVVRLWLDSYPEGRQRVYTLKLEDLPSVDEVLGAKVRLRNLGYYHGTIDGAPNEELRAALAEFQGDHQDTHGLEPTGELDTGTAGALEEVHGS
jgi:type VI secretion system secreted protein VgrG